MNNRQNRLDWLPAEQRISYICMVASLVWLCSFGLAPLYMLICLIIVYLRELNNIIVFFIVLSIAPLIPTGSSPCLFCPYLP